MKQNDMHALGRWRGALVWVAWAWNLVAAWTSWSASVWRWLTVRRASTYDLARVCRLSDGGEANRHGATPRPHRIVHERLETSDRPSRRVVRYLGLVLPSGPLPAPVWRRTCLLAHLRCADDVFLDVTSSMNEYGPGLLGGVTCLDLLLVFAIRGVIDWRTLASAMAGTMRCGSAPLFIVTSDLEELHFGAGDIVHW